jgi:hypothetical protein
MTDEALFYTVSMAKLCARQGHLEKSAEIYRHLLEKNPEREDLKQAFEDVDARLSVLNAPPVIQNKAAGGQKRLDGLIQQWISLLVEKDIKQRFDKIRSRIRQVER